LFLDKGLVILEDLPGFFDSKEKLNSDSRNNKITIKIQRNDRSADLVIHGTRAKWIYPYQSDGKDGFEVKKNEIVLISEDNPNYVPYKEFKYSQHKAHALRSSGTFTRQITINPRYQPKIYISELKNGLLQVVLKSLERPKK